MKISEELDSRLRHEAARRGITFSELTREALETHLGLRPRSRVLLGGATFDSDEPGLGTQLEEILRTEMPDAIYRETMGNDPSDS